MWGTITPSPPQTRTAMGAARPAWNSTPSFGGAVPNHITAGFPTSLCSSCHDTIVWTDSTFNHASTGFPLTNSHQIAPAGKVTGCDQCHVGNYTTLAIQPTDCGNSQCHLTTWQQTDDPTHSSAGTPFAAANCSTCHNTITWTTAIFDHSTTGWPLTGSHQLAPRAKLWPAPIAHVGNNTPSPPQTRIATGATRHPPGIALQHLVATFRITSPRAFRRRSVRLATTRYSGLMESLTTAPQAFLYRGRTCCLRAPR